MWNVFAGAAIFMVGCFFGMLISSMAVAASRNEVPPTKKDPDTCFCGNPDAPRTVHRYDGYPCLTPKD